MSSKNVTEERKTAATTVELRFKQPFSAQSGERCSKHLAMSSPLTKILLSLREEVDRVTTVGKEVADEQTYPRVLNRRGLHVEVLSRGEGQAARKLPQRFKKQQDDEKTNICGEIVNNITAKNENVTTTKKMTDFESRVRSLEGTEVDLTKIQFWRGAIIVPTTQQPEKGYNSLSHITIDYFGMRRTNNQTSSAAAAGMTPQQGDALSKHLAEFAVHLIQHQDNSSNNTPSSSSKKL